MKKTGMAIPMVLGFIVVAAILGTSLLFLSRTRGADSHRNVGRLQLIHVSQSGLHEALVLIKPFRITEIIAKRGSEWKFSTAKVQYGRALAWCDVFVKTHGVSELDIESIGHWQEKGATEKKRSISCRARYSEKITEHAGRQFSTNVEIEGEWKLEGFVDKMVE